MKRHIPLVALLIPVLLLVGCRDGEQAAKAAAAAGERAEAAVDVARVAATPRSPDFVLTALDGSSLALADYRGDVVIVDFWATWCGPCRMVMPHLQSIHAEYADKGVRVIGLSVDQAGPDTVKSFIAKNGYTFPVAMATADLVKAYGGVPSIPTTFIIAPDGSISEKLVGVHGKADYLAAIKTARAKTDGA